jgi:tyrosine-protein kinase Etk/Wzc
VQQQHSRTDIVRTNYADDVYNQSYDIPPSIDVRELLYAVIDGKKLILLAVSFFVSLALIYLIFAERTYEVDALLKIQNEQSYLDSLLEKKQANKSNQLTSGISKDEAQVLSSRAVLGSVVDALNLCIVDTPVYFPIVGKVLARLSSNKNSTNSSSFGLGMGYAWGGEQLDIALFDVPKAQLGEEYILVAGQSGYYSVFSEGERLIKDARIGDTVKVGNSEDNVVSLLITKFKAYPGTRFKLERHSRAKVINELREAITVGTEDIESKVLKLSLRGEDPDDLTRIINEMIATYQRLSLAWESREVEQTVGFLENQLPLVKAKLEAAEVALNSFRAQRRSIDFSEEARTLLQQVATLETRLAEIQQERAALRKKFKPKHDVITALDSQVATINQSIDALSSRVELLPGTEQEIVRLTRNVEVNNELYLTLLNSVQEQRIAKSGSVGNVRIIDEAMVPDKPIWPKSGLILLIAGLLGLFFSLATILIRKGLQATITNPDIVEESTGLPVFIMIPHSENQTRLSRFNSNAVDVEMQCPVLAALAPHDVSIESLRSLRTMLLHNTLGARNNIVMISGPRSGEGKSFVSVNLGAVLAQLGRSVLLVDTDLRCGTLHQTLGVDCSPGLAETITGQENLRTVINTTGVTNLHLIPKGGVVESPSEVLSHTNLKTIFQVVAKAYDYVIIDSPPILDVTDAAIVGQWAGLVLMVTRAGTVTTYDIQQSLKRMHLSGVNVDGCVMNGMDSKRHQLSYGYGYNDHPTQAPNPLNKPPYPQIPLLSENDTKQTD